MKSTYTVRKQVSGRSTKEEDEWIDGILYLRLSNEKQIRGDINSLDVHEAVARTYCKENKIRIVEVFVDRGWSGRKSKRPDWENMLNCLESNPIRAVVAYKLERCARSMSEGVRLVDLCESRNCHLLSATEYIDIFTPSGRKNALELLTTAEFESRNNGSKTSTTRFKYASEGLKNGGKYPPGFKKSPTPMIPEHDERYAKMMQDVYEMAAEYVPLRDIQNHLHRNGYKTPTYEVTRRGGRKETLGNKPIRVDQLENWIRNPMYKGYVHENHNLPQQVNEVTHVKGQFEAIVSEELWAAANLALDKRKKVNTPRVQKRDKWFHPLKGILRCSICGSLMSPRSPKKLDANGMPYRYYRCRGASHDRKDCTSTIKQVPAKLIEDFIYSYIGEIAATPEFIETLIGASRAGKTSKIRKLGHEITNLKNELETIQAKIEKLTDFAENLDLDAFTQSIKRKAEKLDDEYKETQAAIHHAKSQQKALKDETDYSNRIRASLQDFANAVRTLPEEEQRELVKLVIDQISFGPLPKNTRSPDQNVLVEIHLKFGSLVQSAPQKGQKLKVKLEMKLDRGKGISASTTGAISLHVGENAATKKAPKKRTEHEIHRAIRWKKEMEDLGIGQNELARRKGLSNAAVSHTMKLLELSNDAINILVELNDPKQISRVGRRKLFGILKCSVKHQASEIIRLINEQ